MSLQYEEMVEQIARRLAAAYASHCSGESFDRTMKLQEAAPVGRFWRQLAEVTIAGNSSQMRSPAVLPDASDEVARLEAIVFPEDNKPS